MCKFNVIELGFALIRVQSLEMHRAYAASDVNLKRILITCRAFKAFGSDHRAGFRDIDAIAARTGWSDHSGVRENNVSHFILHFPT